MATATRTWKCDVCGYIHRGDAPPDECPVCGVGPELFSAFEVAAPAAESGQQAEVEAEAWRCTICDHVHRGSEPPDACPVCGAGSSMFEPHDPGPGPEATATTTEGPRILVLGGGIAGLTASESARATAPGARITLLSKEDDRPYYRLNLTRYLAGEVDEAALELQPPRWYEGQRIELRGGQAVGIDRAAREVALRDGTRLGYDRLVLASGAHPFVPPIPGVTRGGVFTVRTLADARAVIARARQGGRCVCVGGGLLGLETAGALARRGVQVAVLEGHPWLLPRQLAQPAGELLRAHLQRQGIDVRTGVDVAAISGDEEVGGVQLEGGEELAADFVVLSTGIRPNSYLARQCGLEVRQGVVVDEQMRTSDERIFAAGDVTQYQGTLYGLWPAAYAQGAVAGTNAAGGAGAFPGLPFSARLKVLDVDMFSMGQFLPRDGSYQLLEQQRDQLLVRVVCRDGKVVGANLFGDTSLANELKDAIESGSQVPELTELRARLPGLEQVCRR